MFNVELLEGILCVDFISEGLLGVISCLFILVIDLYEGGVFIGVFVVFLDIL